MKTCFIISVSESDLQKKYRRRRKLFIGCRITLYYLSKACPRWQNKNFQSTSQPFITGNGVKKRHIFSFCTLFCPPLNFLFLNLVSLRTFSFRDEAATSNKLQVYGCKQLPSLFTLLETCLKMSQRHPETFTQAIVHAELILRAYN